MLPPSSAFLLLTFVTIGLARPFNPSTSLSPAEISQRSPMKIAPVKDRVIVKNLDQESTTSSGIIIPDSAHEKPEKGQVLSVGNNKWKGKDNSSPSTTKLKIKQGERAQF